jgi:hypothetical protein
LRAAAAALFLAYGAQDYSLRIKLMEYCLTEGLGRLSLHDSNLEYYSRRGTSLELAFDWAKLANFIEYQINKPIIMGRTILIFSGVQNEELSIYEDGTVNMLTSLELLDKLELIVENELSETTKVLKILGTLTDAAGSHWVKWRFNFATCAIKWQGFITKTTWNSGVLPPG